MNTPAKKWKRERALSLIAKMHGWLPKLGAPALEIPIKGVVDSKMVSEVECRLVAGKHLQRPLELTIDSPGGNLAAAERIVALLNARSNGWTLAKVTGLCASAAVLILLAGDVRVAAQNAKLLAHLPELVPERGSRWTADTHRNMAAALDKSSKKIIDVYVRRTGGSREWFEREMRNENTMSVRTAIACGLLHGYADDLQWIRGKPYIAPPQDLRVGNGNAMHRAPAEARAAFAFAHYAADPHRQPIW